ncbi:uncharacterized protein BX664DRAFT_317689 [Halteromyces radiatus]|uniref:uncharacterized protein n=1 Tax=Halteromyces radiatus TaxID=101107 RepID=UPI00221E7371|nr:uncharacterized protein BX664DRAFT_317689 [Halteromyces radiatus]KAI8079786.1 hypothetical protein BX664DRAFT_317689 [Halteromyces radiatus]
MYRILLFLSLCLCVLSVPIDKKQSLGGNDQTAQALSELLKYVPSVIRDMNLDPIALIRLALHYKELQNQVPANTPVRQPLQSTTLYDALGRPINHKPYSFQNVTKQ